MNKYMVLTLPQASKSSLRAGEEYTTLAMSGVHAITAYYKDKGFTTDTVLAYLLQETDVKDLARSLIDGKQIFTSTPDVGRKIDKDKYEFGWLVCTVEQTEFPF